MRHLFWTPERVEKIRECLARGMTRQAAAKAIGVSAAALKQAAFRNRINFPHRSPFVAGNQLAQRPAPQPDRNCARAGCDKPIPIMRGGKAKYCSPECGHLAGNKNVARWKREHTAIGSLRGAATNAARSGRARALDMAPAPVVELRQQPLPRPAWVSTIDPRVVILPARPAPVKRYRDTSRPTPFQDDINAMLDHGSPGPLPMMLSYYAPSRSALA